MSAKVLVQGYQKTGVRISVFRQLSLGDKDTKTSNKDAMWYWW